MTSRLDKFVNKFYQNYDELFIEFKAFLDPDDERNLTHDDMITYVENHICCVDSLTDNKTYFDVYEIGNFDLYEIVDDKDKVCHRIKNSLIRDCKLCWEEQLIDDG